MSKFLSLDKMSRENIIEGMVEVLLSKPDSFLVIKETLTRMGNVSMKDKKIFQSAMIFHKKGKFYIVHFKEMLALDGVSVELTDEDLKRRDCIVKLLADWKLVTTVKPLKAEFDESLFILPFSDKKDWQLVSKYQIGKKFKRK